MRDDREWPQSREPVGLWVRRCAPRGRYPEPATGLAADDRRPVGLKHPGSRQPRWPHPVSCRAIFPLLLTTLDRVARTAGRAPPRPNAGYVPRPRSRLARSSGR